MRKPVAAGKREVHVIDVEVDDIEFTCALKHLFDQANMMRHLIDTVFIPTERVTPDGDEPRASYRVTTCEERHVMTLSN